MHSVLYVKTISFRNEICRVRSRQIVCRGLLA